MTAFYYELLFLGRKCLHETSQKRAISYAISLAVNYRLFSHGDVSYRFNGKNDNVVLEFWLFPHFSFEGETVVLIAAVPDHCLTFTQIIKTFTIIAAYMKSDQSMFVL